jgi:hypothetical protein
MQLTHLVFLGSMDSSQMEENIGSVVQLLPDTFPTGEVGQLYTHAGHMAPSARW